jgi:RimJ/RimL family protein N-acetyltransferase
MPYRQELDLATVQESAATMPKATTGVVSTDWQRQLPVLASDRVVLRELRTSDATALFALLTTEEVARFISPPPSTVEGFEKFIAWTHRQRTAGSYACFAVTLQGFDTAIGIFQVRATEPGFVTAEWGFALGSPFWGTGLFTEGAALVLEFVFETLGVHRLEARAAVRNGRGNSALRKLGAVAEGTLRRSFQRHGEYLDQTLYAIIEDDWRAQVEDRASEAPAVRVH